jgi:lipid A 3-O-deacylase PagL
MMLIWVLAAGVNAAAADLSLREFNVYLSGGESRLTWHGHSVFRSIQFEWIARSPRVERRMAQTTVGASFSYHDIRQARSWFGYTYGDPNDSVRGYSSLFFARHHWRDNARNVQPFVELGSGPMWSNRRVPAATSRFNMDSQLGVGAMLFHESRVPMFIGYRLAHISNGGTARRNPGLAVHSMMLGVRLIDFRKGARP